jgi:hypothetical protein
MYNVDRIDPSLKSSELTLFPHYFQTAFYQGSVITSLFITELKKMFENQTKNARPSRPDRDSPLDPNFGPLMNIICNSKYLH